MRYSLKPTGPSCQGSKWRWWIHVDGISGSERTHLPTHPPNVFKACLGFIWWPIPWSRACLTAQPHSKEIPISLLKIFHVMPFSTLLFARHAHKKKGTEYKTFQSIHLFEILMVLRGMRTVLLDRDDFSRLLPFNGTMFILIDHTIGTVIR